MATLAWVIGGGSAEGGAQAKIMADWRAAHERAGIHIAPGERMAIGFQFHIASSKEQAMKEAAIYYEENMKMFGELRLVRAISEQQIAAMRDPSLVAKTKLPRIEDAVKAGGFLAGVLAKRWLGYTRSTGDCYALAIPVATAITFFRAPPSSTPVTSRCVYTRKADVLKRCCANRAIADTDLVLWYTIGFRHIPAPEDWPVLSARKLRFSLVPFGFFDRNPTLDWPASEPGCCRHEHGGIDDWHGRIGSGHDGGDGVVS